MGATTATRAEPPEDKDIVPLEELLRGARRIMELMGLYKRARKQLIKYGSLYVAGILLGFFLFSHFVFGRLFGSPAEWYCFFILTAAWVSVTLYHGNYDVEAGRIYFLRVLGGAFLPVGQGRIFFLWPLMDLYTEWITMRERKTHLKDEVELREVTEADLESERKRRADLGDPLPHNASAHPRSIIKVDIEVAYWITNSARYIWLMPGDTKKEREETIIGWVSDHLQTKWNEDFLGENEVVGYKGYNILSELKQTKVDGNTTFGDIEKGWGVKVHWVTIRGTEISEERKKLHAEVYAGQVKGQAKAREIDEICRITFGMPASKLAEKPEKLRELRTYYLALASVEAIKGTDKVIFGIDAVLNAIDRMLKRAA